MQAAQASLEKYCFADGLSPDAISTIRHSWAGIEAQFIARTLATAATRILAYRIPANQLCQKEY
jgi:hypothetical protein